MSEKILERIVAAKHREVAVSRHREPLTALRGRAEAREPARPFAEVLARPGPSGVNIIAEVKRASPSRGPLAPGLDAAATAAAYRRGGAAALSVLTDEPFFQGSLADMAAARSAADLPVLRKDFVVSEYQIYEARANGADAVLLIVRILTEKQLIDYLCLTGELGMDALVEVHAAGELTIAARSGARLVGINNRDLGTFDTDTGRARRLAGKLAAGQTAVAASGIRGPRDVSAGLRDGIFNFLVGESLVTAADPADAVRRLNEASP